MTHFAVAVISDGSMTVEELLLPYMESCCGEPPREYMEFFDKEDEYLKEYESESVEVAKMPDGRILYPWDEQFRKEGAFGYGTGTHEVPAHIPLVKVPFKEKYATFEEFVAGWYGMDERDSETGRYGYWSVPNPKWDWYQIGGRWHGALRAVDGELGEPSWCGRNVTIPEGRFDSAKIGDIDFSPNQEVYDRAIAEWEHNVEGKGEDEKLKWWYSTDYMVKHYGSKEAYAEIESTVFWRAVVTPDGEWHEVGETGWFGAYMESGEEYADWARHFKERFIDPCDPEWTLTVVDCHF